MIISLAIIILTHGEWNGEQSSILVLQQWHLCPTKHVHLAEQIDTAQWKYTDRVRR